MKILYVCFEWEGSDGGAIYDKKLVRALRDTGNEVVTYKISRQKLKRALFPVWVKKIPLEVLKEIRSLAGNYENICVSHEALLEVVIELKPTLFIVHNYFPVFEFKGNKFIEELYRFGAEGAFARAFNNCENVLFLSFREFNNVKNEVNSFKAIYLPPGVSEKTKRAERSFEYNVIERYGTTEWLPKKISSLSSGEIKKLRSYGIVISKGKEDFRSFMLIEDRFLSGFKLKLLDGLYNGDFVLSMADLDEEIKALGLPIVPYVYIPGFSSLIDFIKDDAFGRRHICYTHNEYSKLKSYIEDKFSWNSIAFSLVKEVYG
ncbi:hypothetical protein BGP77_03175 [Saccharospirillum sp. MSK14-1]|uniref:hypothetical protein n=1 Tax=Saccharospirillum sp. MSK14-1 TaxID=1897632 RepID=UPI000D3520F5|nr:hypothetical protein [Saccharospirillum sp. MSK14-1]PTY36324.1 hypothetical protein BGP77_03175 [Saccharospirillum sp. MSK14-1]